MHSETTATEITKQDIQPKNLQIGWSFFASYWTDFKQQNITEQRSLLQK